MSDPVEPYRFQSGDEVWGEDTPRPAKDFGSQPERWTLADRVRLGKRRRDLDPTWAAKSPASRKLLLEIDKREEKR